MKKKTRLPRSNNPWENVKSLKTCDVDLLFSYDLSKGVNNKFVSFALNLLSVSKKYDLIFISYDQYIHIYELNKLIDNSKCYRNGHFRSEKSKSINSFIKYGIEKSNKSFSNLNKLKYAYDDVKKCLDLNECCIPFPSIILSPYMHSKGYVNIKCEEHNNYDKSLLISVGWSEDTNVYYIDKISECINIKNNIKYLLEKNVYDMARYEKNDLNVNEKYHLNMGNSFFQSFTDPYHFLKKIKIDEDNFILNLLYNNDDNKRNANNIFNGYDEYCDAFELSSSLSNFNYLKNTEKQKRNWRLYKLVIQRKRKRTKKKTHTKLNKIKRLEKNLDNIIIDLENTRQNSKGKNKLGTLNFYDTSKKNGICVYKKRINKIENRLFNKNLSLNISLYRRNYKYISQNEEHKKNCIYMSNITDAIDINSYNWRKKRKEKGNKQTQFRVSDIYSSLESAEEDAEDDEESDKKGNRNSKNFKKTYMKFKKLNQNNDLKNGESDIEEITFYKKYHGDTYVGYNLRNNLHIDEKNSYINTIRKEDEFFDEYIKSSDDEDGCDSKYNSIMIRSGYRKIKKNKENEREGKYVISNLNTSFNISILNNKCLKDMIKEKTSRRNNIPEKNVIDKDDDIYIRKEHTRDNQVDGNDSNIENVNSISQMKRKKMQENIKKLKIIDKYMKGYRANIKKLDKIKEDRKRIVNFWKLYIKKEYYNAYSKKLESFLDPSTKIKYHSIWNQIDIFSFDLFNLGYYDQILKSSYLFVEPDIVFNNKHCCKSDTSTWAISFNFAKNLLAIGSNTHNINIYNLNNFYYFRKRYNYDEATKFFKSTFIDKKIETSNLFGNGSKCLLEVCNISDGNDFFKKILKDKNSKKRRIDANKWENTNKGNNTKCHDLDNIDNIWIHIDTENYNKSMKKICEYNYNSEEGSMFNRKYDDIFEKNGINNLLKRRKKKKKNRNNFSSDNENAMEKQHEVKHCINEINTGTLYKNSYIPVNLLILFNRRREVLKNSLLTISFNFPRDLIMLFLKETNLGDEICKIKCKRKYNTKSIIKNMRNLYSKKHESNEWNNLKLFSINTVINNNNYYLKNWYIRYLRNNVILKINKKYFLMQHKKNSKKLGCGKKCSSIKEDINKYLFNDEYINKYFNTIYSSKKKCFNFMEKEKKCIITECFEKRDENLWKFCNCLKCDKNKKLLLYTNIYSYKYANEVLKSICTKFRKFIKERHDFNFLNTNKLCSNLNDIFIVLDKNQTTEDIYNYTHISQKYINNLKTIISNIHTHSILGICSNCEQQSSIVNKYTKENNELHESELYNKKILIICELRDHNSNILDKILLTNETIEENVDFFSTSFSGSENDDPSINDAFPFHLNKKGRNRSNTNNNGNNDNSNDEENERNEKFAKNKKKKKKSFKRGIGNKRHLSGILNQTIKMEIFELIKYKPKIIPKSDKNKLRKHKFTNIINNNSSINSESDSKGSSSSQFSVQINNNVDYFTYHALQMNNNLDNFENTGMLSDIVSNNNDNDDNTNDYELNTSQTININVISGTRRMFRGEYNYGFSNNEEMIARALNNFRILRTGFFNNSRNDSTNNSNDNNLGSNMINQNPHQIVRESPNNSQGDSIVDSNNHNDSNSAYIFTNWNAPHLNMFPNISMYEYLNNVSPSTNAFTLNARTTNDNNESENNIHTENDNIIMNAYTPPNINNNLNSIEHSNAYARGNYDDELNNSNYAYNNVNYDVNTNNVNIRNNFSNDISNLVQLNNSNELVFLNVVYNNASDNGVENTDRFPIFHLTNAYLNTNVMNNVERNLINNSVHENNIDINSENIVVGNFVGNMDDNVEDYVEISNDNLEGNGSNDSINNTGSNIRGNRESLWGSLLNRVNTNINSQVARQNLLSLNNVKNLIIMESLNRLKNKVKRMNEINKKFSEVPFKLTHITELKKYDAKIKYVYTLSKSADEIFMNYNSMSNSDLQYNFVIICEGAQEKHLNRHAFVKSKKRDEAYQVQQANEKDIMQVSSANCYFNSSDKLHETEENDNKDSPFIKCEGDYENSINSSMLRNMNSDSFQNDENGTFINNVKIYKTEEDYKDCIGIDFFAGANDSNHIENYSKKFDELGDDGALKMGSDQNNVYIHTYDKSDESSYYSFSSSTESDFSNIEETSCDECPECEEHSHLFYNHRSNVIKFKSAYKFIKGKNSILFTNNFNVDVKSKKNGDIRKYYLKKNCSEKKSITPQKKNRKEAKIVTLHMKDFDYRPCDTSKDNEIKSEHIRSVESSECSDEYNGNDEIVVNSKWIHKTLLQENYYECKEEKCDEKKSKEEKTNKQIKEVFEKISSNGTKKINEYMNDEKNDINDWIKKKLKVEKIKRYYNCNVSSLIQYKSREIAKYLFDEKNIKYFENFFTCTLLKNNFRDKIKNRLENEENSLENEIISTYSNVSFYTSDWYDIFYKFIFETSPRFCEKIIKHHQHNIPCVKFSPDDRFLLSCSVDKSIVLWNIFNTKNKYLDKDYNIYDHIFPSQRYEDSYRKNNEAIYDINNEFEYNTKIEELKEKGIGLEKYCDYLSRYKNCPNVLSNIFVKTNNMKKKTIFEKPFHITKMYKFKKETELIDKIKSSNIVCKQNLSNMGWACDFVIKKNIPKFDFLSELFQNCLQFELTSSYNYSIYYQCTDKAISNFLPLFEKYSIFQLFRSSFLCIRKKSSSYEYTKQEELGIPWMKNQNKQTTVLENNIIKYLYKIGMKRQQYFLDGNTKNLINILIGKNINNRYSKKKLKRIYKTMKYIAKNLLKPYILINPPRNSNSYNKEKLVELKEGNLKCNSCILTDYDLDYSTNDGQTFYKNFKGEIKSDYNFYTYIKNKMRKKKLEYRNMQKNGVDDFTYLCEQGPRNKLQSDNSSTISDEGIEEFFENNDNVKSENNNNNEYDNRFDINKVDRMEGEKEKNKKKKSDKKKKQADEDFDTDYVKRIQFEKSVIYKHICKIKNDTSMRFLSKENRRIKNIYNINFSKWKTILEKLMNQYSDMKIFRHIYNHIKRKIINKNVKKYLLTKQSIYFNFHITRNYKDSKILNELLTNYSTYFYDGIESRDKDGIEEKCIDIKNMNKHFYSYLKLKRNLYNDTNKRSIYSSNEEKNDSNEMKKKSQFKKLDYNRNISSNAQNMCYTIILKNNLENFHNVINNIVNISNRNKIINHHKYFRLNWAFNCSNYTYIKREIKKLKKKKKRTSEINDDNDKKWYKKGEIFEEFFKDFDKLDLRYSRNDAYNEKDTCMDRKYNYSKKLKSGIKKGKLKKKTNNNIEGALKERAKYNICYLSSKNENYKLNYFYNLNVLQSLYKHCGKGLIVVNMQYYKGMKTEEETKNNITKQNSKSTNNKRGENVIFDIDIFVCKEKFDDKIELEHIREKKKSQIFKTIIFIIKVNLDALKKYVMKKTIFEHKYINNQFYINVKVMKIFYLTTLRNWDLRNKKDENMLHNEKVKKKNILNSHLSKDEYIFFIYLTKNLFNNKYKYSLTKKLVYKNVVKIIHLIFNAKSINITKNIIKDSIFELSNIDDASILSNDIFSSTFKLFFSMLTPKKKYILILNISMLRFLYSHISDSVERMGKKKKNYYYRNDTCHCKMDGKENFQTIINNEEKKQLNNYLVLSADKNKLYLLKIHFTKLTNSFFSTKFVPIVVQRIPQEHKILGSFKSSRISLLKIINEKSCIILANQYSNMILIYFVKKCIYTNAFFLVPYCTIPLYTEKIARLAIPGFNRNIIYGNKKQILNNINYNFKNILMGNEKDTNEEKNFYIAGLDVVYVKGGENDFMIKIYAILLSNIMFCYKLNFSYY
ncbi:WD repeat-containing protein, putative [Plasmodium berghei]|uniref:WD repeat-containing protein, putative n=2 Tax=Plasmodium berghei TaxID=5821 RepID=A0A509AN87_PLABA|nr:WD repeat-containing protein, putative [Plasmodium berghei ANKA]SCL95202.1 WD repeat-containing protein, putative [Plasmodium berghei]SCM16197.1 WD repeat-containing protein, putative [Plasmodium berghei]SCM17993.1 WD repeat-containing protein, putative [Plasmodium berghei]SCN26394.1 WD repeat-containing protein, putative [Plasmodium berghei]VUC56319.1 WD repeat-containing protein, putative [Plasmodium berghei ANKA]|eukprot:XP_034422121.1 WD repeat-containing protein, putative [Plasmodium berghei ANKA]